MKEVGDIVVLKGCKGLYWMINDIITDNEGESSPNSIGYEIIPFYPVEDALDFLPMTVYGREVTLYAKGGTEKATAMEELVIHEILTQQPKTKLIPLTDRDVTLESKKPTKKKPRKKTSATNNGMDVIKYNQLDSTDECLDALNDLKDLHNAFGDEAYEQLREVVMKRLKELT